MLFTMACKKLEKYNTFVGGCSCSLQFSILSRPLSYSSWKFAILSMLIKPLNLTNWNLNYSYTHIRQAFYHYSVNTCVETNPTYYLTLIKISSYYIYLQKVFFRNVSSVLETFTNLRRHFTKLKISFEISITLSVQKPTIKRSTFKI